MLGNVAGFQHIGIVGDLQRHVGVLLDQQNGHTLVIDRFDNGENILHNQGRKTQRGFIHHQHLRAAHQCPAHGQHLLLTAGQRTGQLPMALLQTGEQIVHPSDVFLDSLLILTQVSAGFQILQHRQVGKYTAAFGSMGNALFQHLVDGQAQQFLIVVGNRAAVCLHQAGNGTQHGGLACAVGADQGDDLSLRHFQINAAQGLDAAVGHV